MSKGCDLAWRWSSNCHNNVWVRSSLIHRARWLLHKRSHEWVSCLMRRNEDLHSHELKAVVILCFINSSCLSRLGWFPCQHALPRRVRLLAKEPIIIDLLASPWAKKETEVPCQLVKCQKHFFKKTTWWHGPLAHCGHLSITLNSKWKCDRRHQSLWKACRGTSPLQLLSSQPDTS